MVQMKNAMPAAISTKEKFCALGTPINRCEVVCKPFELPPEEKKHTGEAEQ